MTSDERMGIHLKDNYINDKSQIEKVKGEVAVTLRYLSSHSLSEMKNDKGCDILVMPHSFKETKDEIGDSYVLSYAEDKDGNSESITTGNLVGFIGYNGTDIRIHSRFSYGENDEVKDYFLYYMLGKVLSVNFFDLSTSSSRDDAVIDLLLFFFPRLLKDALSQGMYKKYVYHEYNDANIRGVVDVNRHIRLNIPANGKIAYRTREFSYDNSVTQLIRHTIEFIRRKQFGKAVLHNDPDTEGCVQQIIQATPTFQPQQRQAIINENLRPVVHPYYTKYAALQNLCLRILRYEKLSYGNDSNNKIHGLLIDAAWLWEEYVAKVLAENGSGLKHYTQKNSKFKLFEREEDGKRFQPIIPDYYDADKNIVADAKYIPLHRTDHLDADRASAVYYKTIMYMYRFNSSKGFLFHPVPEKDLANYPKDCHYSIIDTNGTFHKIGLVAPTIGEKDDYAKFKKQMHGNENEFVELIKKAANL